MSIWKKIWVGFFFLIITIPMLCHLVGIDYKGGDNERRTLAEMPDMPQSFETFKNWNSKFENYLNDNIPFRTFMVKTYNSLSYSLNISPSKNLIVGKDGWIFNDYNAAIEQHLGRSILDEKQANNFVGVVKQNANFFESKNIPFYFFIAPNKHTIFSEFLPDYANNRLKVRRNFDVVMDMLKSEVKIINVRKDLLNNKNKLPYLYFKNDTHWNRWGAFVAYQTVMGELKKSIQNLRIITWGDMEQYHYTKVGELLENLNIWNAKGEKVYGTKVKLRNRENGVLLKEGPFFAKETHVITTKNKNGQVLLLIRDSFSDAMLPFYEHSFSKIITTHHEYGDWDSVVLEHGKPDVVIFQMVERYLNKPFKQKQFPQNFSY